MADTNYRAGLDNPDDMSMFPSAVSPLEQMGLTAEQVRANPELLKSFASSEQPSMPTPTKSVPGLPSMPITENVAPKASPSAVAAGAAGGAGAASVPTDSPTTESPTAGDYTKAGLPGVAGIEQQAQNNAMRTSQAEEALGGQMGTVPAQIQQDQQARDAAQAASVDPSQYKASLGQKIWRGVRGGLVGGLTGGVPGALLGVIEPQDISGGTAYGAPGKGYDEATAKQAADVKAKTQSYQEALDNFKLAQDARTKSLDALKEARSGYGGVATEANAAKNADTAAARVPIEQQTAEQNSPAAKLKLSQDEFDQRGAQLQSDPQLQKLSPINKILYRLNGKVPDPREPNEAEITAAQAARALVVFRASHGGKDPQTLEDFNSVQAAARGMLDRGATKDTDDAVSSIVADATGKKQEFADKYEPTHGGYRPKGSYDTKNILSPEAFQNKMDSFANDANVKLAKYGAQIDPKTGQIVRQNGAAAADGQNAAPAGAPPKGAIGTVMGSDGKRHWTDGKGDIGVAQ